MVDYKHSFRSDLLTNDTSQDWGRELRDTVSNGLDARF